MRAKTILVILFLVSLGVIATLVLRALPSLNGVPVTASASTPAVPSTREVLVATAPLATGTLLRAQDVAWKEVSGGSGASDEITRPSPMLRQARAETDEQARAGVYGAALRVGLDAGESIRRGRIVTPGDRDFLQVVLRPGARAIAIPVATGGASTGLLSPGDRVDVLLTQTFRDNEPLGRRAVGETIVRDLRVVAIDAPGKAGDNGNGFGRTVTLEVTSDQAEKINVATELGKLTLALRSIDVRSDGAASLAATGNPMAVRSTWAGDVSPALGDATSRPQERPVVAQPPTISIIRGSNNTAVKAQ